MLSWLKRQWADVKGNAKWDLFKWAFGILVFVIGSIGLMLRGWFFSLSLPVEILTSALLVSVLVCVALSGLLYHARKRPYIEIKDMEGKLITPQFLLPREIATSPTHNSGPQNEALFLKLITEIVQGDEGGVMFRVQNIGLKPLNRCLVTIQSFASFHQDLKEFRRPTFKPAMILPINKIEPEEVSPNRWLVRLRREPNTLGVPSGTDSQYRDIHEGGIWKAVLKIAAGDTSYEQSLYVEWEPGSNPLLISPPLGVT